MIASPSPRPPRDAGAAPAAPERGWAYKWELVAILWVAFFLNQADRQIFNVVLPLIKADLQLTDVQLGLVGTIFTAVFAVLVPFAGYAGDVLRRKWLIVVSLLFWSTATLFTGISTGLLHLVLFRSVTTGGGEAFYFPAATSLIGQLHRSTRALAISIHQTAVYAGLIASGYLAGYLGERFGWRTAFYAFGAFGIVFGLIALFRLRDTPHPPPDPKASADDRQSPPLAAVARQIVRKPTVLALFLAYGGRIFANIGFLTWMPTHLHERFSLSLADAGFTSMVYYCGFAMAGTLLGGKLSDHWAAGRATARLETQLTGLALAAPFLWLMGSADSLGWCSLGLAGFGFFTGIYDSNQIACLFDVTAPRIRSSAVGLMVAFGFAVGALAPVLLGWLKTTHGLSFGIAALSGAYVLAAGSVVVAIRWCFARDRIIESPGAAA